MLEDLQSGHRQFSFDEYNHMLNLQCNIDPKEVSGTLGVSQSGKAGFASSGMQSATDADRTMYNEYLIDLHSYAMNGDDW